MTHDRTYAVLDLETTGTSPGTGDRIIQIGCAFVRHQQIIGTYTQLVAPKRPVPSAVQRLTGITPEALVNAPDFASIAPALARRLKDTVLVAHNVGFDVPFLSAEFQRVGLLPLTNPAIDTVELAQVLLPTMTSFRLGDLTKHLNITHDHPHRADADAVSTAELLLTLRQRFVALPSWTKRQLVRLSAALTKQTGDYLASLMAPSQPLAAQWQQVGAFVLRRVEPVPAAQPPGAYPLSVKAKRALLQPRFQYRKAQATMMDAIYHNATNAQAPLLIEAGTGLGKSLGYLLPYAYVASSAQPVVVSTATTALQAQLLTATVPALAQCLKRPLPAVLLKSPRHYVDLQKLAVVLQAPDQDRLTRRLLMRLLVWLTQTTTGDLSELNLTNLNAPLFAQIAHSGDWGEAKANPYWAVDFYHRIHQAQQTAQVIITNHAYLAQHPELGEQHPFLVVDEAHHFADAVAQATSPTLPLAALRQTLHHLRAALGQAAALTVFSDSKLWHYQSVSLQEAMHALQSQVEHLQRELAHHLLDGHPPVQGRVTHPLDEAATTWLEATLQAVGPPLAHRLLEVSQALEQLQAQRAEQEERFGLEAQLWFMRLRQHQLELTHHVSALNQALTAGTGASVHVHNLNDATSLRIEWAPITTAAASQQVLLPFVAPTFVGATLTVQHKFDYLKRQLGLGALPPSQTMRLQSPFHYRNQAQVFAVDGAPNAKTLTPSAYADYLAQAVSTLAAGAHQTIVLFNSLATIEAVYHRLSSMPLASDKELLAQGVTGSAAKIAKRFAMGENSLVLGAWSFFEGLDFPERQLEQVILTRLPFSPPDAPLEQARAAAFTAQGLDPFTQVSLPQATLRLRQAFGRLIRTAHDRGVFVVIDPRLITTDYGRAMQRALPAPLKVLPLDTVAEYATAWLDHQPLIRKEDAHAPQ